MISAMMAARAVTTSQSSALSQKNDSDHDEDDQDNIPNEMTLHHNLSTSNWSTALKSLHTNPHSASIWIINRHGRMLPLHAALLYGAPSHVVMEVLNAYPDAAKEKDLQGRLPIHIAASMAAIVSLNDEDDDNGEQRVLNELVRVYPESMWIPDEGGRTAMELVEILQVMQSTQEDDEEEEGGGGQQLKSEVQPSFKVVKDSEKKSKEQKSLDEQHQYCQQLDDALAEQRKQQQRQSQQQLLHRQRQQDQYKSMYDLLSQGIAPSHNIPPSVWTEAESDDCSPIKGETTNKVCSKRKELHQSNDQGFVGKERHEKPLEPPKQIIINAELPQQEDDSAIHADECDEVLNDRDNVTSYNEITHAYSDSFDKNEEVTTTTTTTTTATTNPSPCNETKIANSNSAAADAMDEIKENGTNKAKRHLSNLGSKIQMRSKRRKKGSLMDLVSTIKTHAATSHSKEKESGVVPSQCNCDTCNAAAVINEEMNIIKRALRSFDLVMPTLLFDYLVASHWDNVMARIRGAPSEVKAWARKEENGEVVLDVLPLHAAIVLGAPSDVIIALLDAYPAGAGEIDGNRSFPIHLAAACLTCIRRGDLVVDHLLKTFRSGKHAVDAKGRTPSEIVSIMSTSHDHRKEYATRIESNSTSVSHESSETLKTYEEEDAAFAYLVEKAMTNLDMPLKYQHSFLCQASMKGIETIDDLLMAEDEFLEDLFSEKELTVELKRLLSIFIEGRG